MAERPVETSNRLFQGAAILTAAAIITKILSAIYRIPFQNIVGDIGFYIYQQVYPVYGISIILSTYGFPVVISKLIAEKNREAEESKQIALMSFFILSLLGILLFGGIFFGSHKIAEGMGDRHLAPLFRIISFSFLYMPLVSMARGYFQGKNDMLPTAVSQMAEQSVRVFTILLFTYILMNHGYSLYDAGAGAIFGSLTGGTASIIILISFLWFRKEGMLQIKAFRFYQFWPIAKTLLGQGMAFCITSMLLTLTQLIDSLNLYSLLMDSGFSEAAAKGWKGVYDRGQPLLQLGSIAATSLSLSLVPLLSSYISQRDRNFLMNKITLALKVTITLGSAASIGLICIIKPTNIMLFTDDKGSIALALLAISVFFSSLIMTIAAILQSLGKLWVTVAVVLGGLGLKWLFNIWLIPQFLINGAALATVFSFGFICVSLYFMLHKKIGQFVLKRKDIKVWLTAGISMSIILLLHALLFLAFFGSNQESRLAASMQALSGVMVGGSVYVWVIIKSGMFAPSELALLPFGTKLAIIGQKQRNQKE